MNYITPYENVLLKKLKARQKRDIGARQKKRLVVIPVLSKTASYYSNIATY